MSRLFSLIRERKLLSGLVGCTLAVDVLYYSLQDRIQAFRAYRVSCTQPGSTEMKPVSADLLARLRSAGEQLGIDPLSRANSLQLFVCRNVDPVRMGKLSAVSQAFLGLPEHYDYKAGDTELRHSFFFEERPLSLNTKNGKQLYKDCLLLSDDEKAFVMARELLYLTSSAVHVPPLAGNLAVAGLFGTLYWLNHGKGHVIIDMRPKRINPTLWTSILTVAAGGMWYVMAYQWYAAYFKSLDARVDRRAAAAFPAGAVTFYQKQVKRNTLLRTMLGEGVGKKYFTIKGNENNNWLLSDPFLPVNQRWSKLRYDQTLKAREIAATAKV